MRLRNRKSSDFSAAALMHFCTASRAAGGDLELNGSLGLVLHHDGARGDLVEPEVPRCP
jgi:hypothetical protein